MLKTFKLGGIHPQENKITASKPSQVLPLPKVASIPVGQHIGAPSEIIVKKGDAVKVGQLVAQSAGFISANIHSSVSGVVDKIDTIIDSSGYRRNAIIIQVDGDEWVESIDKSDAVNSEIKASKEDIIKKINEAGIVGMGGATFPSHVKTMIPAGKKAEYLLINGVECEPYLTSDHALMLEKAEEIIIGIELVKKALNVDTAIIGIENNKPDAIEIMTKIAQNKSGIKVQPLKVKYPQGGEKQLIKALINKEVPSGGLPIEVGAVVFNVGTLFAIYEAVQKNKPLFERFVTITGKELKNPGTYKVRIGTPITQLIEAAGGLPSNTGKVVSGGPMMGKAISNLDAPIAKGSSGVVLFAENEAKRVEEISCIRCGKCVTVCPMGLEPYLLNILSQKTMLDQLEINKVTDCVECGSCQYTCPAGLPLLDYIRLGKGKTMQMIRARKN